MARNTQFDGGYLPQMSMPYNINLSALSMDSRQPHAIDLSYNIMYQQNGSARLRPAVVPWKNSIGAYTGRVDKLLYYETADTNVKRFWVFSAFVAVAGVNQWKLSAYNIDTGAVIDFTSGAYNLRNIGTSIGRVHELLVDTGKLYIKAFLTDSTEFLGSAIWDGGTTCKPWGMVGPTTPVALTASAGWTASAHNVTINFNWYYTYCYKSITGQLSNRAPLQTNPDKAASGTGALGAINKCPEMAVPGLADTTNYPTIVMFRTTDGGGTFYELKEITNTGAGSITFRDQYLESGAGGGTFNDPLDDATLQNNSVSPSLTSNSPPPTVLADDNLVVGTDPTETFTSNMVVFKRRIWYAVKNVLFYSANEELNNDGVLKECFPSGLLGNFIRFPYKVLTLAATSEALYIVTTDKVFWIRGDSKASFADAILFDDIGGYQLPAWPGGAAGAYVNSGLQAMAITTADKTVIFGAKDGKIVSMRGQQRDILSDALSGTSGYFSYLNNSSTSSHQVLQLDRMFNSSKDWLIVNVYTASLSRTPDALTGTINPAIHIYDFNDTIKGWHPIWRGPTFGTSVIRVCPNLQAPNFQETVGMFTIRYKGTSTPGNSTEPWDIGLWSKYRSDNGAIAAADISSAGVSTVFSGVLAFSGLTNPSGNHVNTLRVPCFESVVNHVWLRFQTSNHVAFAGTVASEIQFQYDLDNSYAGANFAVTGILPPRSPNITNVTPNYMGELYFPVNRAAYAIFPNWTLVSSQTDDIELLDCAVVWNPDKGA